MTRKLGKQAKGAGRASHPSRSRSIRNKLKPLGPEGRHAKAVLKSIVGKSLLEKVEDKFGSRYLRNAERRLVRKFEKAKASEDERNKAYKKKVIAAYKANRTPLSKEQISNIRIPRKLRTYADKYRAVPNRLKGGWDLTERTPRGGTKTIKRASNQKEAIAWERGMEEKRKIAKLADTLGLTRKASKALMVEYRKGALKDLERFKKTKKYKELSAKAKRRYTKERAVMLAEHIIEMLFDYENY